MSNIILNEENLKTVIAALSDSELSEDKKSQFATELNELLNLYSVTQKLQTESDKQLIKEKEKLKKLEKSKTENFDTPKVRDRVREIQTENTEITEKLNNLEVKFNKLVNIVPEEKLEQLSIKLKSDLKSDNEKLNNQIRGILEDNHSLRQTAESLKFDLNDIRAESLHKQREIELYETRLSQLTNNLEELTTIKDSYKNRSDEQSELIAKLYKTIEEVYGDQRESP